LGLLSEFAQVLKSLQESFLDCILGIFSVMRNALSDSVKFAIVSLYELLEGRNISILAGVDKMQVVACHFHRCELCRGFSHIRVQRLEQQSRCNGN